LVKVDPFDRILSRLYAGGYYTPTREESMRGAVSVILMLADGEYHVPIFNIGRPDPHVAERRRAKVVSLIERMGAKHIMHPEYVKPTIPPKQTGKLL
jgi:hypothetical protein